MGRDSLFYTGVPTSWASKWRHNLQVREENVPRWEAAVDEGDPAAESPHGARDHQHPTPLWSQCQKTHDGTGRSGAGEEWRHQVPTQVEPTWYSGFNFKIFSVIAFPIVTQVEVCARNHPGPDHFERTPDILAHQITVWKADWARLSPIRGLSVWNGLDQDNFERTPRPGKLCVPDYGILAIPFSWTITKFVFRIYLTVILSLPARWPCNFLLDLKLLIGTQTCLEIFAIVWCLPYLSL